jgi:hypothetical protein
LRGLYKSCSNFRWWLCFESLLRLRCEPLAGFGRVSRTIVYCWIVLTLHECWCFDCQVWRDSSILNCIVAQKTVVVRNSYCSQLIFLGLF